MMVTAPYPPGTVLLLAGTEQGLFLLTSRDRVRWNLQATGLQHKEAHIFYAMFDPHHHYRLFAADNRYGAAFLRYSDDFGDSWQEPAQSIMFAETGPNNQAEIWYIEPGRPDDPHTLYAGTGPANLWVSHDSGQSWQRNASLDEKSRHDQWENGDVGTCVHSIVADPQRPERMWLGISGAGSVRTEDNGANWQDINQLTQPQAEGWNTICTSTHRLLQHTYQPDTLYQQSRCGLFRSTDAGDSWTSISHGLPSTFGFPLTMDINRPDTLFTLVVDANDRYPIGNQLTVYRSQNGGEHWEACTRGLPTGAQARQKVLRHGMCTDGKDPCGIYIGTRSGNIFASPDNGDSWRLIGSGLPTIYSVTATVL
ncbi:WD40/YVTN/BNR-like repeat-containing protein [Dictyobacter formicarum]|uniref:Glycosyl hydrolase n=1 Tax=Dictyobacter formicarum TaxID=2778368 RepID=A0ABQ3VUQ2_9CHLR|nr:hypothetical protein [Dictyobacter formicarum]GHO89288.1 glycosyl hydrolase [Dictyobacter formicarum]